MEDKQIVKTFIKTVSKYGEFDDAISAYVSLLYLIYTAKHSSDKEDRELTKTAESIAKSYYQRFAGKTNSNIFQSMISQVADLRLSEKGFRSILSSILSDTTSHSGKSASTSFEMACLVSQLLDIKPGETVLDFGSGNGSFLSTVEQTLPSGPIKPMLCGIEPNNDAATISKMVLTILGANFTIFNKDGFSGSAPKFDKGYVYPPSGFSLNARLAHSSNSEEQVKSKASIEWLFVLKALDSMKPKGKLIAFLPESCLFKSADSILRKKLISDGLIEGIVSFPPKAMIGTFTKMNLVVFSKGNKTIRVVDGQDVMQTINVRGLNETTIEALKYTYLEGNADVIPYERINVPPFSLNLDSLRVNKAYCGLKNLVPLGVIYNIDKGTHKTLANFSGSISRFPTRWKILTSGNIENGNIDYDSMPYVYDDESYRRYEAVEGDIIITSKSSKVKIAIVDKKTDFRICVTGAMLILRPRGQAVQLYTKLFLESEKGKQILASAQKGTVITSLSKNSLNDLLIPFPDVKEQESFVRDYQEMSEELRKLTKEMAQLQLKMSHYFDSKTQKGE